MMTRNYYYLTASLPDLVLDGGRRMPSVREFIDEITPQVHPADAALFNLFRYPSDNALLSALIEKREHTPDGRGLFSAEELAAEIKAPDRVPNYMRIFIEAYKEGRLPYPELSIENQIAWLFYDEACANADPFVRQWFAFDRDLRNVCAAYNCRRAAERGRAHGAAFRLQRALIGRNDVTEALVRSSAPDFGLASSLPWIERLAGLGRDNPVEFEKGVDAIRWDTLNELTVFSYFSFATILAFTVKLGMVERWQQLDEKEGAEIFEKLVQELTIKAKGM